MNHIPITEEDIVAMESQQSHNPIEGLPMSRHRFNLYVNMLRKGPCGDQWESLIRNVMSGQFSDALFYNAMGCYGLMMDMEHDSTRMVLHSPFASPEEQADLISPLANAIGESYLDTTAVMNFSILPYMLRVCLRKDHRFRDRATPLTSLYDYSVAVSDPNTPTVIDYYEKAIDACFYRQQTSEDLHDCSILQFQQHVAYQLASSALAECVLSNPSTIPLHESLLSCFEISNSHQSDDLQHLKPEVARLVQSNHQLDDLL